MPTPPDGREHKAPKDKPAATKEEEVKANEKAKKGVKDTPAPPPPKPPTPLEVLYRNVVLLEKYVDSRDSRYLGRVLRYTNTVRRRLPMPHIRATIDAVIADPARRAVLQELFTLVAASRVEPADEAPSADGDVEMADGAAKKKPAAASALSSSSSSSSSSKSASASSSSVSATQSPSGVASGSPPAPPSPTAAPAKPPRPSAAASVEVEAYFFVLGVSMLVAQKAWEGVSNWSARLIDYARAFNRRTLDVFTARAYSYAVLAAERQAGGSGADVHAALRTQLLHAHRTATLRHDEFGIATLLSLLVRGYVHSRQYDAAAKLIAKAPFPEAASPGQLARFLYYKGRTQAVGQLDYSDAHASLTQSLRKAPAHARGLITMATKFDIVAQMLMGDIPERSIFSGGGDPGLRMALQPYFELTLAVRGGDMGAFWRVVSERGPVFETDGSASLVRRLEANVIKAGLRRLATSYSTLTFKDVASKLGLASAEDAEFLCAKAIRDGVIEGTLDHSSGTLTSLEAANVYSTSEPQEAFTRRIGFLLDVHTEAVKGMRFPGNGSKGRNTLESAEERLAREQDEAALARDIEEGEYDDEDDGGEF